MKKNIALSTLLLAAIALTVACGDSKKTPVTPPPPGNPTFTKMVFESERDSVTGSRLLVSNLDLTGATEIPFDSTAYGPSVSADLSTVSFISQGNLWVGGTDGSGQTQLTNDGNVYNARVSPDGTLVVFPDWSTDDSHYHLIVGNLTTLNAIDLNQPFPDGMTDCYVGSFSPDSAKVVMECYGDTEIGLFTIKVDGTSLATVFTGVGGTDWYWLDTPNFSDDGTQILFYGDQPAPPSARSVNSKPHHPQTHSSKPRNHFARRQAAPGVPEIWGMFSVNLDGGSLTVIVPGADEGLVLNSTLYYDTYDGELGLYQIHTADLDGSNDVIVSDGTTYDYLGNWSDFD